MFIFADRAAALDTGAAASPARFRRLERHNKIVGRRGVPCVTTVPTCPRFQLRGGRPGGVRCDADIPVGIGDCRERFAVFMLGAGIAALLRKVAPGGSGLAAVSLSR